MLVQKYLFGYILLLLN